MEANDHMTEDRILSLAGFVHKNEEDLVQEVVKIMDRLEVIFYD
ncbi:hypothetical protein [Bacillus pinisoli]|nr:hypothetical protein [Bacillus pinisoli]